MGILIGIIILGFIGIVYYHLWLYQQETKTDELRSLLSQKKCFEANAETNRLCLFVIARQVRYQVAFDSAWTWTMPYIFRLMLMIIICLFYKNRAKNGIEQILEYSARGTVDSLLLPEDVENFPHSMFSEIDLLWARYSNGHFGFSIQKQIYENCHHELSQLSSEQKNLLSNKFSSSYGDGDCLKKLDNQGILAIDKLGWYYLLNPKRDDYFVEKKLKDFDYSLNSPKGHLPAIARKGYHAVDVRNAKENQKMIRHIGLQNMFAFWKL